MSRKPAESITKLTGANQFKLCELVREKYAEMKKSDLDFAAFAQETLGCTVTHHNVAGARAIFDILSTRKAIAAEKRKPVTRLDKIEERLAKLEAQIAEFFS